MKGIRRFILYSTTYMGYHTKDGRLKTNYYPFYSKNIINRHINNSCLIIFKSAIFEKKNNKLIKMRAICKYNQYNCKKFIITVDISFEVKVFSSCYNFCHKNMLTASVKGVERAITKQDITRKKPSEVKLNIFLAAKGPVILETKNC